MLPDKSHFVDSDPNKPPDDWKSTVKRDPWDIAQPEGRNDLANARRFQEIHGAKLRFCHPWHKWLVWDGKRFQIDQSGAARRLASDVPDLMWKEARLTGQERTLNFVAKSASNSSQVAMLTCAQSLMPIEPDEMDSNPWLLNCENGTLDLRTGTLREHRREDCLTKLCPTKFNPDASSFHWDRFLEDVLPDQELIDFVQRYFGYSLTGTVGEQVLPIFWGGGSNGKSTLLNAFLEVLGRDYAMQATSDILLQHRQNVHPTGLTDLSGKRFVSTAETDANRRLSEATLKTLTGGEKVRARRMREDFWEFDPTHKLVLSTNHKPLVRGTDHAIWRRLILMPFTQRFEGDQIDKSMPEKLAANNEGILAWAVRGCLQWQAEGPGQSGSHPSCNEGISKRGGRYRAFH